MTQEQKRIKIAEVCGIVTRDPVGILFHTSDGYTRDCPDYFSDLNAMHEVEIYAQTNLMNAEQWADYAKNAERTMHDTLLTGPTITCEHDLYYEAAKLLHATAAQRAEAFGRTLNLWTGKD